MFEFGFTPVFAEKKKYLFNARAEGRGNTENIENYTGPKRTIYTKSFQSAIRNKRCLVIADAYYEGPKKEKLQKPYLFYLRNKQRPFCFAGIWDKWTNKYLIVETLHCNVSTIIYSRITHINKIIFTLIMLFLIQFTIKIK